jgi:hypothetical protein
MADTPANSPAGPPTRSALGTGRLQFTTDGLTWTGFLLPG